MEQQYSSETKNDGQTEQPITVVVQERKSKLFSDLVAKYFFLQASGTIVTGGGERFYILREADFQRIEWRLQDTALEKQMKEITAKKSAETESKLADIKARTERMKRRTEEREENQDKPQPSKDTVVEKKSLDDLSKIKKLLYSIQHQLRSKTPKTTKSNFKQRVCYICRAKGHLARDCPFQQEMKASANLSSAQVKQKDEEARQLFEKHTEFSQEMNEDQQTSCYEESSTQDGYSVHEQHFRYEGQCIFSQTNPGSPLPSSPSTVSYSPP